MMDRSLKTGIGLTVYSDAITLDADETAVDNENLLRSNTLVLSEQHRHENDICSHQNSPRGAAMNGEP